MASVPGARDHLRTFLRWGLALTALTPLVASDRFIYPTVFPKTVFFRLLVETLAVGYGLWLLRQPKRWPGVTLVTGALLAQLGALALAGGFGVNPYQSFAGTLARSDGVITFAHLVAFALIARGVLRTPADWQPLLKLTVAVFAVGNLFGLGQLLHVPGVDTFGQLRPSGTLGNPGFFASWLIFGIALPLALAVARPASRMRAAYLAVAAASAVNLVATQARAPLFAALAASLALALALARTARARRAVAAAGVAAVVGLALLWVGRDLPVIRGTPTLQRLATVWTSPSVHNRLITWGIGLEALRQRPLLGWGPENFLAAFDRNFDPAIIESTGTYSWYDRAHSTPIEYAVTGGLLGLGAYLAVLAALALTGWQALRSAQPPQRRAVAVLLTGLAAHTLQNLAGFDTLNTALLWVTLAAYLDVCAAPLPAAPLTAGIRPRPAAAGFMVAAGAYLALTVNLLPLAAAAWGSQPQITPGLPLTQISDAYARAFRLSPPQRFEYRHDFGNHVNGRLLASSAGETDTSLQAAAQLALAELRRTAAADPGNVRTWLILGELTRQLARTDARALAEAEFAARQVIALAPQRYHGYFALGRAQMSAGRTAEGVASFGRAVALNPWFLGGRYNLAVAHVMNLDLPAAQAQLDVIRQLDAAFLTRPEYAQKLHDLLNEFGFTEAAKALKAPAP